MYAQAFRPVSRYVAISEPSKIGHPLSIVARTAGSAAVAPFASVADCRGLVRIDGEGYEMPSGSDALASSSNVSAFHWMWSPPSVSVYEVNRRHATAIVAPHRGVANDDFLITLSFGAFGAFADETSSRTLQKAVVHVDASTKLFAFFVQHACGSDCFRAEGCGATRRLAQEGSLDHDPCATAFCSVSCGHFLFVRVTVLSEADAGSVAYTFFSGSPLVGNLTFLLQIDLKRMVRATASHASYPSTYPTPGELSSSTRDWPRTNSPHADVHCAAFRLAFADVTVCVSANGFRQPPRATSPQGLFVDAGFSFAYPLRNALSVVGEDKMLTTRAWTAGDDVYA